jgi:hypothetical protein
MEYSGELIESVTRETNSTVDEGARATEPEIVDLLYGVLVTPRIRRRYSKYATTDPSRYVRLPALAQSLQGCESETIRGALSQANTADDGGKPLPEAIIERILEDTKPDRPHDTKVIPLGS